jgi:hypothetical protein
MATTCIRCREAEAPRQLGFCAGCAAAAEQEASGGYDRLAEYLGAWAAFDEWLQRRGLGQAS